MRLTAYLPLFAMLAASTATAAPWVIDPAKSTLTFTGTQAGDAFTGKFTKFTPVVEFDPEKPEAGKITVTVDMASASIKDADKQESLPTEDWFFIEKFPTATFTSSAIRKTADGFLAEGTLNLRGISQPVQLPFSLKTQDSVTQAQGELVLQREKFGVGQGQWKDDQWVAFPVTVAFHLYATPGK